MRVFLLMALLGANVACAPAPPRTVIEGANAERCFRAVVIDRKDFFRSYLLEIARDFLREEEHRKLAKLAIFTDKDDAVDTTFGKSGSSPGYRSWLPVFQSVVREALPMADVIVIHGAGVLRYRNGGHFESIVLTEHNPLLVSVEDRQYEIVEISLPNLLPWWKEDSTASDVEVFLKSSVEPRVDDGYELTRMLSDSLGTSKLTVTVRADVWFIGSSGFPYYFRLTEDVTPPTYDEYYRSEQVLCLMPKRGQLNCTKFNPVDEAGLHPLAEKKK